MEHELEAKWVYLLQKWPCEVGGKEEDPLCSLSKRG